MSHKGIDKSIEDRKDYLNELVYRLVKLGVNHPNDSQEFKDLSKAEKDYVYEEWGRYWSATP